MVKTSRSQTDWDFSEKGTWSFLKKEMDTHFKLRIGYYLDLVQTA